MLRTLQENPKSHGESNEVEQHLVLNQLKKKLIRTLHQEKYSDEAQSMCEKDDRCNQFVFH